MVTSKGYAVTTAFTTPLPANGARKYLEIQNNTTGTLFITIGASVLDADAVQVLPGEFYVPLVALGAAFNMRSTVAGNVTVVGDDNP